MMVIYWDRRIQAGAQFPKTWLKVALVLGFVAVTLLHQPKLIGKITGKSLPTLSPLKKVIGWKSLARVAGESRTKLLAEGRPVFIIGGHYSTTSEIAFYLPEAKAGVPDNPLVYFRTTSRPVNQYFFWPGYQNRKGQNAIYVELNRRRQPAPASILKEFESVTDLGLREITERGRVIRTVQVFECRNLR